MSKLSRGRLLFSTCLSGAALALASGAHAQTSDSNWQPRADVEAETGEQGSQVSLELFAPLAQNDANLLFVTGRVGSDEHNERNGSVTIGARGRVGNDVAIGVNAGVDFYRSPLSARAQTAASFGLEGFTSVFDVRLNYRLPVTDGRVVGFIDPNASPLGVLSIEQNRLIERKSGFRIDEVPLGGFNGEVGARATFSKNFSVRASVGGFDYRDDKADRNYRGLRGGLELDLDDPVGAGSRFSLGARLEDDNRFGTQARATARLSIPLGRGSRDRSAGNSGIDRQMGDRLRRDYVSASSTRYSDLTSTNFATDDRTGQAFGGIYYTSGTGVSGSAGTSAAPTTIGDAVTRAGTNGVVVALGSGGTISTGGVTLATNQYLVGGASSVDVRHTNGAVTQFGFGGTNGVVVGTNAAGAAVTLGQGSVVRDLTIRGSGVGVAANNVGGFALDRLVIENTGGAGLSLTNTLGAVVVDGLTVRDGAGAGVLINGGGNVTLRNSTIGGGAGAVQINDNGATLTTTLSNLTLSATGGTVLDIDGSGTGAVTVAGLSGITIAGGNGETGGFAARFADFDASATAGIQTVNAGRMQVGTNAARVNGAGVSLTEVTGALGFTDLDVSNDAGTGLTVDNTKSGDFTLTTLDGTVDTTNGTALDLDPLFIDLNFASVSSTNAAGAGVMLDAVTGAGAGGNALTIGTLTITNPGLQGLFITGGSTGLVTIGGGSITNSGGASVQVGEAGVAGSGGTIGLNFGASIADAGAGPLISLFNMGGAIRFTGAINGAGPILVDGTTAGSSIAFTGAATLTGAASPAISIDNLLGSFSFTGPLTIANPLGDAIRIGIVTGGVTFGDVDITGLGAGTGVDLTGTLGNVTFNTLDIAGAGVAGSTGIDLTGAANPGAIVITNPSTIQGVDIGVDLTNAAITGSFRFGDGNSGDGLESTITANTPIAVVGLDTTHGTYDFADVNLNGDNTGITGGSFTAYYVQAGATGSGASSSNPGSLAGAEASGAQYIVLLNDPNGGQDVIDAIDAGGSLDLVSGQTLVSFLYTDFFAVTGATVPANLIVSGLGDTGITNPFAGSGAAILTTTAPLGAATVNLADGAKLDGVVVQNAAVGGGFGVAGSGVANVVITNSNISGTGGAVSLIDNGAASSATLSNLDLSATGGTALVLDGSGAGTLAVSGTDIQIAATGTAAAVNISDVAVGTLEIGAISTGTSAGAAVQFDGVTGGSLTTGAITVGGTGAGAGVTISDSSATITTGAVSVTGSAGDAVAIIGNSGTIGIGALDLTGSGGAGLRIENTSGSVTVAGGTIANSAGGAVMIDGVAAAGSVSVGALSATGSTGAAITVADVDGSASFTATTTIANSAGIVLGAGSTGTIGFGDVDITGLAANMTGVDARNASGTVSFNTLDITGASTTGTRGIDLTGATWAGSVATAESGSITGVGVGVDLTNAAITGSFRYGDGSNLDTDGAASIINAVTPIAVAGVNGGTGTYDFRDANLTGDTTGLATNVTMFWVRAGSSGAGTRSDPGSIGAAEASGATIIVLVNDPTGGNDTIDANEAVLGAGGTFDMLAGQQLLGFLNGDTLNVPGAGPVNVLVYGIAPGVIINPFAGSGAPTLTTTAAGMATVNVTSNTLIDGVTIANPGGAGILGSGAANVAIRNSRISGADSAIDLSSGGGAASAALSNLLLWASNNSIALVADNNGGGTMTVTQLSNITVEGGHGEGAATDFFNAIFDADLATAGAQTVNASVAIGTAATRANGYALGLNGSSGALNFTSLSVYNTGSSGLVGTLIGLTLSSTGGTIDTVNGNTISVAGASLDLVLDRVGHSGAGFAVLLSNVTGVGTGGRALDVTNLAATGGANAIFINGASSGNLTFGAASSISGTTGAAIALNNTVGALNVTYDGSVTQAANAALLDVTTHTGTVTFGAGSNLSATNGTGLQFANADGIYNFNGTTTLNGGDAGIDIVGGSAGTFTFGANTSITSPTGTAININASTANVTYSGSVSQANNAALLNVTGHSGGTLTFDTNIISATNGTGLQFSDADGVYAFNGTTNLAGGDAGVDVLAGSGGTFIFGTGTTIDSPTGAAINIDASTASLTYSGDITQTSAAALVNVNGHSGGTLTFDTGQLFANASGFSFTDADGTYNFNGVTGLNSGSARLLIQGGSAGSFTFGSGTTIASSGLTPIDIVDSTASLTYSGVVGQSAAGVAAINILNHSAGTLDFQGATLVVDGSALVFDNADGIYQFGSFGLVSSGILIRGGSAGAFTFGDIGIFGLAANTTAVDLRGATGNVTFNTLNISGASLTGTRGIDLTGSTTAASIIVSDSSNITGVGTGVDLTNAAITGTFRYGDGSSVDADGAASTINATIPLVIAGLNSGVGTYDFRDVNMVGDTSGLASSATLYWVRAGASGAGTRSDPGSIGAAEASGANIVILLNDPTGGDDTIDANEAVLGAGGNFAMLAGQQLVGFLNGDTINVPGGAPANVQLFGISTGSVTNPFAGSGAPTLTTTAGGADTVTAASNVVIDGVVIANTGGTGVYGSGLTNVTIRNSWISGSDSAIELNSGGAAASAAFSNLQLWASNNSIPFAAYVSGGGTMTVTQLSNVTIEGGHGEASAFYFVGANFDSDLATVGDQVVNASVQAGSAATRINGDGVNLTSATGTLNFAGLSIYNSAGIGLRVAAPTLDLSSTAGTIDTLNGNGLALEGARTDLVLDSIVHAGTGTAIAVNGLTGIGAGGRAIDVANLQVTGGTNAVSTTGNVTGGFSLGALSSISGTTGAAIALASGTGTLDFRYDGGISQTANAALLDIAGHTGTVTFGATSNLSSTNGTGLRFNNADGTYAFNGTTTMNGGNAGIGIANGSAGTFTFGANTSVTSPTGTAIDISDSTANVTYSGNVTQANNAALLNVSNHNTGTLTFNTGTLSATNGTGLSFSNADGIYNFNGTTTLGGGDAALDIITDSSGSFTFGAGTSITSPTGTAINVNTSTANLTYSGSVTQANNAALLSVSGHSGTIGFTGTLSATDGTGLQFNNADGTYNFAGTTTLNGGDAGLDILSDSSGSFTFGAGTSVTNASGPAISVGASTANVTYSGMVTQSTAAVAALDVSVHSGGTLDFSGATINVTGGNGFRFFDADGIYTFGDVALSGGARIAILGGSAGVFTFGDVDITGLSANSTAVDLTGATGNVTFHTLDITSASLTGTKGIDATGTTAANIIVSESGNITNVAVGIDLTNAAITNTFRYGDGSNVDADHAASNITATTPLLIAGLNGGVGTYNFADVNLNGDTSNLSVSAYFVLDGATGIGTRSNPGSLTGAEASNATYIVLLNNPTGGNDTIDATSAGGSLDLDGGQFLYSFRDTDSFVVGGGAPANVFLYNVQTGVIDNPYALSGAPTLTAGGVAPTVVLNGANVIDGVVITNTGSGAGVSGSGATNIIIRNSTISGGAGGAINIADGGAATVLSLGNLNLAAAGGNILNLVGTGAGTLTISGFTGLTATHTTETGGFAFDDVTFDSDAATGGFQALNAGALTLGITGSRIVGDALSFNNVVGTLNFTDLNIANTGGTGLLVTNSKTNDFLLTTTGGNIDTTSGTAIDLDPLTINMILNTVTATGGTFGIRLDTVEGAFTVTGAVNVSNSSLLAIGVVNNTAQTDALDVNFQGAVTITGSANWGVYFNNNAGATANFTGGVNITTASGTAFEIGGGGTVTVTGSTNSINSAGAGLRLQDITVGAAGVTFNGITTGGGTALFLNAVNLTGAVNVVGLTSTFAGTAGLFNGITGAGGVNLTGTLDIDSGTLEFTGDLGTINIANVAGSSLTIDGGANAIYFIGVEAGTVNIASAAGAASIGATTSTTVAAIRAIGDNGGTLNYGGTIRATAGNVLNANTGSLATINLSGAITSTTAGTAFNFANADGVYSVSGSVSHTGGAGVAVDSASSGNITFSNASNVFSAGSNTAIDMQGTGTLTFSGGGLDIDTTSGTGLAATGGTLIVTGANNTIDTTTGRILNLSDISAGAGGINFASLKSSGTVANTAINLNNLDGTSFSGGTVTIAGTSGAASDGIFIGGGSAASIGFGATTIANTGNDGIEINGAGNGAISFSSVTIDNTAGNGVNLQGSTGSVTISGGAIGATDDPAIAGVRIADGSGAVTINSEIKSTTGQAVSIGNITGGTFDFGGNIATSGTAQGVQVFASSGGTVTFSGASKTLAGLATAVSVNSNTNVTVNFTGGGLAISNTGNGFQAIGGGTVSVTGAGNTISATNNALVLDGVTVGANGINFASVIAAAANTGISLTNVASAGGGSIALGTVNLQGITSRGIDITGTLGAALNITDLDIGLNGIGAIALDLNGATLAAGITANDFDVTSTTATITMGVDMRGTTGGQIVRLGDASMSGASSTISGVGTGVYLDAATNVAFTYGDGEAVNDTGSTISATTAINAMAAPVAGTYDFRDVALAGSPGLGFGIGSIYFVDSNGATGGGNGSGSDGANPGTLAAVESLAAGSADIIVLINNGFAISAAGSNGNDTLALNSGAQVRGFGNGAGGGAGSGSAPIALTLTVPSTILLAGGNTLNIADPTGLGAATLTSAVNANVITLGAADNRISGFILDGQTIANRGIKDNGAGATNTVIDFMTIRNFGNGVEITPSTSTTIDNVTFSGNGIDILLNASNTTISNITSTGASGASIFLSNTTGTTTLNNVNISSTGAAVQFVNPAGTINATNVDISGNGTGALGINGGTASFNFDATSSITQSVGGAAVYFVGNHTAGTFSYAGTINATTGTGLQFDNADGTYAFTGTTILNGGDAGIDILNGSSGTFTFGAGTSITNPSGTAFRVLGSSGTITYNGAITANNGYAVSVAGYTTGTMTFGGAISASGSNARGIDIGSSTGAFVFNGEVQLSTQVNDALTIASPGVGNVTFAAGGNGLDITTTSGRGLVLTGGGTLNISGSGNSITTDTGTAIDILATVGAALNASFANVSTAAASTGISIARIANTLTGTVNIAGGTIRANSIGIDLTGDALDFTYGGAIITNGGSAFAARVSGHTAGTVTFSGNITHTSSTGGISASNNTGGAIAFTGQNIGVTTQNGTAVSLTNNTGATISFAPLAGGDGLDISTNGTGLVATGGGTLVITGTGNSITTQGGQLINLDSITAGAGGINFESMNKQTVLGGAALRFNNLDGSSFTVTGGVSVGASGSGETSLSIGGGSAATFNFASYTSNYSSSAAIRVDGAGNGTVTFGSVSIDNVIAGDAIVINNSDNAVTINGGSIQGISSGRGIYINGGTGAATIAASVTKSTTGNAVQISGHTVGTLTLSGNINASGDVDNGIAISGTGGTVNFTGQTINLSTGAFNGVAITTPVAGAVYNFNPTAGGNGLDITTTSGTGFSATGGTVSVTGSGNTITTATGQILNLDGVTAGAAGITFASLTGTGTVAATAVRLNNLDGGAFSGGTVNIAGTSSSNDGIFFGGGSSSNVAFGAITIASSSRDGIEINGAGNGTFTATSATIDNTAQRGIYIVDSDNNVTITGGAIGATNDPTLIGIYILNGTGNVSIGASLTKTTDSNVVLIDNHETGAITLSGNISATGNGANGIVVQNVNSGIVTFSGTSKTISTGGFNGVDLSTNNAGSTVNFTNGGLAITTLAGTGLTVGGGSVTVSGTGNTITAASGAAFVANAGSSTINVNSAITVTGSGRAASIQNRSGLASAVTLSGNITSTATNGTGILVSNNTGGAVNFSGTSKTLSTGNNAAVTLTNNGGSTIDFTNGGLAITTTSGAGFTATGGGTVTVQGSGNTITSTTGTALTVSNTTIGAAELTFQSISSNGAANGIVLNTFGSTGGLTVTGTGTTPAAAGTGGTIQNSTGDGISLTSTVHVLLSNMNVINNRGDGIGGSNIDGFLINRMTITGNGNDAATDESGINLANLTGSGSLGARPTGILNSTISNNNEFEVQIANSAGALTNFQVLNTTISSNGLPINGNASSPHGNLFNFLGTSTSSMGITVTNSDFIGNWNAASPPATITGFGLFIDTSGSSMVADISGSRFTNNNAGINVSTGPGSSTLTYRINNNDFVGQRSTAINDFQNGNASFGRTVYGTITNNRIGTATANSGSSVGNGISIGNEGAVDATYLIDSNTIQQVATTSAIAVNVGLGGAATGGGTTNLTITNNNISNIGSRAIVVQDNQDTTGGGPYPTINLSLSGNIFGAGIFGQAGNGQFIRIRELNGTVNVTQAPPTAATTATEIDNANGFNDAANPMGGTYISIGGTPQFGKPAPALPTTPALP